MKAIVSQSETKTRTTAAGFIVGAGDFDSLSTNGYTRLIDSPDVAAAVGKIADTVSDATIHLMKNTADGDVRVKNELAKFMDVTPYSLGTRKTFISWIVTYMLTDGNGNAFVLPMTEKGLLKDLVPMPGATAVPTDRGLGYRVLWQGQYFEPEEVLHFPYRPDLSLPWRGRGIRMQLRDVLGNLKQASATTKGFLSDKWKPSVIIKVDAMADEFDSDAGRRKLVDQYVANQEAGRPWVIPSELMDVVQVKPLSLSDLAINDSIQLDKRAVAAAIGVPPYAVGIGTFDADEHNNFVRTTVNSIVTIIRQELTKKLLLSPELYFKFNDWKLYAYGLKDLARVGDDQYVRGIMSGNEVRDWLGLSPVKGMDERVILENYIPAGMVGEQKKLNGGKGDE